MATDEGNRSAGCDRQGRASVLDHAGHLFQDERLEKWEPNGPGEPQKRIFEISQELFEGKSDANEEISAGDPWFVPLITRDPSFAVAPVPQSPTSPHGTVSGEFAFESLLAMTGAPIDKKEWLREIPPRARATASNP